jgi:hypothetical protein
MAKTFITSGTGASQTLDSIQNEKVPVYNTRAAAEADLANLEEGQIVATKDTGATEKVVDVVEDGNMNPVTSNAVADLLELSSEESGDITIPTKDYQEWQSTVSSSKVGYHLVSAIAGPVTTNIDAIICTVHERDGYFRVTIYNAAGINQTSKFALRVFWMKD